MCWFLPETRLYNINILYVLSLNTDIAIVNILNNVTANVYAIHTPLFCSPLLGEDGMKSYPYQ